MNRTELIRATAKRARVTQAEADAIITAALDVATETITAGEPIKIQRFGALEVRQRKGGTTHNFKTGEPMERPPYKTIAFIPAADLKEAVNATEATEGGAEA